MLKGFREKDTDLAMQLFDKLKSYEKVAEELEKMGFVSLKTSKPLSPVSIMHMLVVAKSKNTK